MASDLEDVITMGDMALIYQVTDEVGIDRELIRVELTKEDPGSVKKGSGGALEIVIPLSSPLESWLTVLKEELEKLV